MTLADAGYFAATLEDAPVASRWWCPRQDKHPYHKDQFTYERCAHRDRRSNLFGMRMESRCVCTGPLVLSGVSLLQGPRRLGEVLHDAVLVIAPGWPPP